MKRTTLRHMREHRHITRNGIELFGLLVKRRDGSNQPLRIRMERIGKKLCCLSILNAMSRIHNQDPIRHLGHHAHIMRDEHNGGSRLTLHAIDNLQDLSLNSHVKRRCGFVAN